MVVSLEPWSIHLSLPQFHTITPKSIAMYCPSVCTPINLITVYGFPSSTTYTHTSVFKKKAVGCCAVAASGSDCLGSAVSSPARCPHGLGNGYTCTPVIHSWPILTQSFGIDNGKRSKFTKPHLREIKLTVVCVWRECLGQEDKK